MSGILSKMEAHRIDGNMWNWVHGHYVTYQVVVNGVPKGSVFGTRINLDVTT